MRRPTAVLAAAVGTVCLACSGAGTAPVSADTLPSQDQWLSDVRDAMAGSQDWLATRIDQGGGQLAINLDIDNTALATDYDPWNPVWPVLRFATYARWHGVAVLFTTARRADNGALGRAEQQLLDAGYTVDGLCGRADASEGAAEGKQRCRREFTADGYTIVANVGNNDTDFTGGNYEKAFQLPNYGGQLS